MTQKVPQDHREKNIQWEVFDTLQIFELFPRTKHVEVSKLYQSYSSAVRDRIYNKNAENHSG